MVNHTAVLSDYMFSGHRVAGFVASLNTAPSLHTDHPSSPAAAGLQLLSSVPPSPIPLNPGSGASAFRRGTCIRPTLMARTTPYPPAQPLCREYGGGTCQSGRLCVAPYAQGRGSLADSPSSVPRLPSGPARSAWWSLPTRKHSAQHCGQVRCITAERNGFACKLQRS